MSLFRSAGRSGLSAAMLAVAMTTELAGLGLVAGPAAAAAAPRPAAGHVSDPTITITAGGDRTGATSVAGLAGVRFEVFGGTASGGPSGSPVGGCTTGGAGTCDVAVNASTTGYWVAQQDVPPGWFRNTELGTGTSGTNTALTAYDRVFTGPVTGNQPLDIPVPSPNGTALTSRGSAWAASRDNPALPGACGLRVALLFDLSTSIISPTNNLPRLKAAGNRFVSALTGTPSSIALYTFGTVAPAPGANNANTGLTSVSTAASAAALTSRIDGYSVTSGQATNWDHGIWQIANSGTHYDATIVLTDGDPTRFGPTGLGSGANNRLIDVENGIFSANALKSHGTKVIAVGIGTNRPGSVSNLKAISGTGEGDDYFVTNFDDLGAVLKELALRNCAGTVNVTKLVIPASSPGDTAAASLAPGWTFAASPATVVPQAGTTDESGAVSFATHTASTQPVTVTETVQSGYTHFPVNGQNAVCRNNTTGAAAPVTDAPTGPGFTVDAVANQIVSCQIYNQQEPVTPSTPDPASVVVRKTWVIDGVTRPGNSQDPDFQAGLALSPLHPADEPASWGQERHGYLAGDSVTIGETDVRIPPGCTRRASGDLGSHPLAAGLNTFTVINTVTCDRPSPDPQVGTHLTLAKRIQNPFTGVKLVPLTAWTLTARHAQNGHLVLKGTTGVTGPVQPGVRYLLAESAVPGYAQQIDPGHPVIAPGTTASWQCVDNLTGGRTGLEDFDGGSGAVVVQPGRHVTCTAVNRLVRAIPVGPASTGGGLPARPPFPAVPAGLGLMAAGALLGAGALLFRRRAEHG